MQCTHAQPVLIVTFYQQQLLAQQVPLPPTNCRCCLLCSALDCGRNVSLDEQRRVLMKRRGSVVGRRSILKSYTLAPPHGSSNGGGRNGGQPAVEGVSEIR